jgi:hypothetical protein
MAELDFTEVRLIGNRDSAAEWWLVAFEDAADMFLGSVIVRGPDEESVAARIKELKINPGQSVANARFYRIPPEKGVPPGEITDRLMTMGSPLEKPTGEFLRGARPRRNRHASR